MKDFANTLQLTITRIVVLFTAFISCAAFAENSAVFTGLNIEENSSYYYLGGVYALNGDVTKEGLTLRATVAYGEYDYKTTGVTGGDVDATQERYNAGVGYQWIISNVRTSVYMGADVQHHNLDPNDRLNHVRNYKDGVISQIEAETTGDSSIYLGGIGNYSTAFDTYWARLRAGMAVAEFKVGPEAIVSGNTSHDSKKFGIFAMMPLSNTMGIDTAVGYVETDGVRTRRDNHGAYISVNFTGKF